MKKIKAIILGMIASFFFAFTFVLNRSMNLSGGYWMYSAILRYIFTLPILSLFLLSKHQFKPVFADIKEKPFQWFLWSTVGFGMFYLPLTAASLFAESWFVCAMWQITIVSGVLLTPLFGKKLPIKNLCCSILILFGILLMQCTKFQNNGNWNILLAFLLILVASFSYPLGNRKTMAFCNKNLSTLQRVFGMTLCSMPFWFLSGVVAFFKSGLPQINQVVQASAVALFSGVIATVFFFKATDMVKEDSKLLAAVEATQCGEVIFTLILGVLMLKDKGPDLFGWIGLSIIVIGMILTSVQNAQKN